MAFKEEMYHLKYFYLIEKFLVIEANIFAINKYIMQWEKRMHWSLLVFVTLEILFMNLKYGE